MYIYTHIYIYTHVYVYIESFFDILNKKKTKQLKTYNKVRMNMTKRIIQ